MGTLLGTIGIDRSEPMLFGLGEALGFVFLNLASLPLPFIGRSAELWTAMSHLLECCAHDEGSGI